MTMMIGSMGWKRKNLMLVGRKGECESVRARQCMCDIWIGMHCRCDL
jgi:hypothetical protein